MHICRDFIFRCGEREEEARVHSASLLMFSSCPPSFRLPRRHRRGTEDFFVREVLFELTKQPVVHAFAQMHRCEIAFEVIVRETLDEERSSWASRTQWTDQFDADDDRWERLSEVTNRNTTFILGSGMSDFVVGPHDRYAPKRIHRCRILCRSSLGPCHRN